MGNAFGCFSTYAEISSRISGRLAAIPDEYLVDQDRVLRAWEDGGLLVPSWNDGVFGRLWLNVISHMAAAAVLGCRLAEAIGTLALAGYSISQVVEALLIHDAFKRREDEAKKLAKSEGRDVAAANRAAEEASGRFLLGLGFDPIVVSLAQTTGDLGLDRIDRDKTTPFAAKLVLYADSCVSDDRIVTYKKKFDDLLVHFQPSGRYEFANDSYLKKYGMSHRQRWDMHIPPIQKLIASLVGRNDPDRLPLLYSPDFLHGE